MSTRREQASPLGRRRLLAAGGGLALSTLWHPARAQSGFPSRPLTWVVPYPTGSYGIGSQPHVWCQMLRLRGGPCIGHPRIRRQGRVSPLAAA